MSHLSDPCWMGQHDRCKSPYCTDDCGCRERQTPVKQGDSGRLGAQIKTAPMGALTPNTGASPTGLESTGV